MQGDQLIILILATFSSYIFSLCATEENRTEFSGSFSEFCCNKDVSRRRLCLQNATARQAYLNSFSKAPQSAQYGINKFSYLTPEEFRDVYLLTINDSSPLFSGPKTKSLPDRFDWRDRSVVAPVQNQQAAANAIAGSPLEELSVQQLVDCSVLNHGCNGGSPTKALTWLQQTRVKLVLQLEYPYTGKTGICRFFPDSQAGVMLKNFTAHDFSGQEEAMMGQLVSHGPLTAIVDAVSWQDYLGGIIQHHCTSHWSNHAVLVVGYDTTGEIPYWIVQNSWGSSWGNAGYVYIKIGGNLCGIADSVATVFL